MPWTPSQFADRHNHALHGERAAHAAGIANAVLRSGVPEGESIAIANKWAERHRDAGGGVDSSDGLGGFAPSASTANPLMQGMIQRYSSMPTEKLAELATMMGGSQQGQIVQRLLAQRRMMPAQNPQPGQQQAQPQQQPQFGVPTAQPAMRRGGTLHRAFGGDMGLSPSQATPWWTRREADTGFLHGATPGRADSVRTTAPGGSYVLPADVVAGLGEGNSLAGAKVWDAILHTMPYGISGTRSRGGMGPPRPPAPMRQDTGMMPMEVKKGGELPNPKTELPVALSHGEIVVSPENVRRIGGGDLKRGHRILDEFVMHRRKKDIKTLQNLKPPVGMKRK